jgi:hypothetical protein
MKRYERITTLICTLFVLFTLVACSAGGEPPANPPSSTVVSTTPSSPTSEPEHSFTYLRFDLEDDPTSRWQETKLTFMDSEGNPLEGLEVSIDQVDLDFMFSNEYGDISLPDFTSTYEENYWAMGLNTWRYGLYFLWFLLEPTENDFRWWVDYPAMVCGEIQVGEQETCTDEQWQKPNLPQERMERMFATADMGLYPPNRQNNINGGLIPAWTEPLDVDGKFREAYGDFLQAAVTRYQGTIDIYRIGLESNLGNWNGGLEGKGYAWLVDWIKWQCDTIKAIDPHALISVDMIDMLNAFPEQDPQTTDWSMIGTPNPMWETQFAQLLIDAGADFDLIGIEYHPGWNTSLEQVDWNLEQLEEFGKPIYIWEFFVPSGDEPEVLENCTRQNVCPEEGYSEAFQSRMAVDFFQKIIEDHPSVVGIEYLSLVDNPNIDLGPGAPHSAGLLHLDGSPKQAYTAIRDYWYSLFYSGDLITDPQGQVQFQTIPGWFKISVDGSSLMVNITRNTSGKTIQIPGP